MGRLRLVKVLVQPVFLLDDGDNVVELEHPVVAIPAAEWPSYSGDRFAREVAEWQQRIDAEQGTGTGNGVNRRAVAEQARSQSPA